MRRTAAAIGTVAAVGLLAMGCGSSDSDDTSGDDVTTTSAMTAESAMTDAVLGELLLTPEELGTGWTEDVSSGGGSSSTPSCLKGVEGDSVADADMRFANGETVFAFEGLGAQASEEDARAAYEEVTTAFDECTDLTFTSNGEPVPGTITPNGEAGFGDASKSYTMAFSADGVPVGIDVVVAYVGDIDVIVMYGTLGTAQPGAVDTMAQAAIDKITSGTSS